MKLKDVVAFFCCVSKNADHDGSDDFVITPETTGILSNQAVRNASGGLVIENPFATENHPFAVESPRLPRRATPRAATFSGIAETKFGKVKEVKEDHTEAEVASLLASSKHRKSNAVNGSPPVQMPAVSFDRKAASDAFLGELRQGDGTVVEPEPREFLTVIAT